MTPAPDTGNGLGPRFVDHLPNALDPSFDFGELIGVHSVGVCLDFDGTLSPIVADPDAAILLPGNAQIIYELASLAPTAIVSGREAAQVRARLPEAPLFIAGSHGFEILGPKGESFRPPQAALYEPIFNSVAKELHNRLSGVSGVIVEEKPFGLSVHDRQVPDEHVSAVRETVASVCAPYTEVIVTTGKRVSEVRPTLDWNKGHAVRWIVQRWGLAPSGLIIYIGDDRTDEDAFAALGDNAITVVVADGSGSLTSERRTWARFKLADPGQVQKWLSKLTDFLRQQTKINHAR